MDDLPGEITPACATMHLVLTKPAHGFGQGIARLARAHRLALRAYPRCLTGGNDLGGYGVPPEAPV
jgi:hypothetical protein